MLVEDVDVVAPVRARVFVPESDHVTELVNDDAELVTVLTDRDRLRTTAALTDERTAPAHDTCRPVYQGLGDGEGVYRYIYPPKISPWKLFCALIAADVVRLLVYRTVVSCSKNYTHPK